MQKEGKGLKNSKSLVFCVLLFFAIWEVLCVAGIQVFFSAMDEITVKYGVSVMLQKERDEIMLLNVMVNEVVRI